MVVGRADTSPPLPHSSNRAGAGRNGTNALHVPAVMAIHDKKISVYSLPEKTLEMLVIDRH